MPSNIPLELITFDPSRATEWEGFLKKNDPDNLLQSYRWGEFRQLLEKRVRRFGLFGQGQVKGIAQLTEEGSWPNQRWILSRGPVMEKSALKEQGIFLELLWREINRGLGNRLLVEPLHHWEEGSPRQLLPANAHQPKQTSIVDLQSDDEKLLARFKPKTRYNIRLAERKGVVIMEEDTLDNFLPLLEATESRQGIALYGREYFQALLDCFAPNGKVKILTATWEGIPVASLLLVYCGKTAFYLFGGTSSAHREVMANYLLHFAAMKQSRADRMTHYDFWGIAQPGDPHAQKWAGITRFKLGFGGETITYPESREVFASRLNALFVKTIPRLLTVARQVLRK